MIKYKIQEGNPILVRNYGFTYDNYYPMDNNNCKWILTFFGSYIKDNNYILAYSNTCFKHFIPYNDDTKHLIGTNKKLGFKVELEIDNRHYDNNIYNIVVNE